MRESWPTVDYERWSETCDTLHAHTQVLGKLAAALAPPEPQWQHVALRVTARGWETAPLPAPDGSGALVVALDLRTHEAIVEHSRGRERRIPLTPHRAVADVTGHLLHAVAELGGHVRINPAPQEVPWTVPLDEDHEHARYDTPAVENYFAAAAWVALRFARFRAPFAGRSTPVNAWWGSFDLAVNLFSGAPAVPPAADLIMRNAMNAQEVAIGWWPGDPRYPRAAFYAYAYPAPDHFSDGTLAPAAARWDDALGEYALDWADVGRAEDPEAAVLAFAASAFRHACEVCEWDPVLTQSIDRAPIS